MRIEKKLRKYIKKKIEICNTINSILGKVRKFYVYYYNCLK